jgi:lysophospholipase L1-like esterase
MNPGIPIIPFFLFLCALRATADPRFHATLEIPDMASEGNLKWISATEDKFAIQQSDDLGNWQTLVIKDGVAGIDEVSVDTSAERGFFRVASSNPRQGRYIPIRSVAWIGDSTTAEAGTAPIPEGTSDRFEAAHVNAFLWWTGREIPVVHDRSAGPSAARRTFAVGGSQSSDLMPQVQKVVSSSPRPSHCGIKIGTNDVSRGIPLNDTLANVRAAVAALRQNGVEPVLYTITPWRSEDPERAAMVAELNTAYANLADELRLAFIDCRDAVESAPGTERDGMLYDNLHDNGQNAYQYGKIAADTLMRWLDPSVPSAWDVGQLAQPDGNWQTLPTTSYQPAKVSTRLTLEPRTDGGGGGIG